MIFKINKNAKEFLEQAGYTRHNRGNGYVYYPYVYSLRTKKKSRFHAIIKREWTEFGFDNEAIIDIHYDKDQGTYHSAALKYDKLVEEMHRIFDKNGIRRYMKRLGITQLH